MTELQRSPQARERAERALVWLLHELREDEPFLVVLGGLVPGLLTSESTDSTPPHLGTTDVDVLLITHVEPEADLGPVEEALKRLSFQTDPTEDGWRWEGLVDGSPVLIEFLCDLDDYRDRECIRPAGCRELAAANLRGTGYVEQEFEWRKVHAPLADGTPASVDVRFAGLNSYLISKCVTVRNRSAPKDYYDLAYVLLHNTSGGPEAAAEQLRASPLSDAVDQLRTTFIEVRERYRRPTDDGPRFYAEQALRVEPEADAAFLRADAVDASARFFAKLKVD